MTETYCRAHCGRTRSHFIMSVVGLITVKDPLFLSNPLIVLTTIELSQLKEDGFKTNKAFIALLAYFSCPKLGNGTKHLYLLAISNDGHFFFNRKAANFAIRVASCNYIQPVAKG